MLKKVISFIFLFFVFSVGHADFKLNLDGNWKIVDFRIPGIGESNYEAEKNVGGIAVVRSGVLKVKLFDATFLCKIYSNLNETIKTESLDFFNPEIRGSIKREEFHFSSDLYFLRSREIEKHKFSFSRIMVDSDLKKMILEAEGVVFLLQRQK